MFREVWITALGFAFSIVVGHFMTAWTVDSMWGVVGVTATDDAAETVRPHAWQARVVGIVERFLYTATTLVGQYGFIPVWLVLKVAGQWRRWSEDSRSAETAARAAYNAFLVGSGIHSCMVSAEASRLRG